MYAFREAVYDFALRAIVPIGGTSDGTIMKAAPREKVYFLKFAFGVWPEFGMNFVVLENKIRNTGDCARPSHRLLPFEQSR